MARPLTLAEIEATFKKWGVPYKVAPGAATRSNSSRWGDRQSVTGCMYHHTAGDARDALELNVIVNGRTGLAGPLANFGVGDDGTVYIVACGSANHAGGGDPETLALVQQEKTPLGSEVHPNEQASSARSVGGNNRFYGWEVFYGIRNDKTVNPVQHRSTVLSMAAIVDKLDEVDTSSSWTGKSVIGHREWTVNKPDPAGVKLYEVRQDVNEIRRRGPASAKTWHKTGIFAPTPAPTPTTGGTVATDPSKPSYVGTPAAVDVVQALMRSDVFPHPDRAANPENPYVTGYQWLQIVGGYAREAAEAARATTPKEQA